MRPSGVTCQTVPVFVSTAASRRDRPGECAGHASVNEFGGSWGRRRVSSPGQRGGCHRRQRTVRTVSNSAYGVQTGLRGSGWRPLTGSQGFSRKRAGRGQAPYAAAASWAGSPIAPSELMQISFQDTRVHSPQDSSESKLTRCQQVAL